MQGNINVKIVRTLLSLQGSSLEEEEEGNIGIQNFQGGY
jgi:hypothetical protein